MKYAKLGNSDLNVSRICMGCMGFGDSARGQHSWTIDEEHTREIIKRGLELGVNFYDTAIAYQSGTSEQYVGRALRDFAKRVDVVVATKFLPRTQEEISAGVTGQQHIETMINASLKNLGMDYVDLYIYHVVNFIKVIQIYERILIKFFISQCGLRHIYSDWAQHYALYPVRKFIRECFKDKKDRRGSKALSEIAV